MATTVTRYTPWGQTLKVVIGMVILIVLLSFFRKCRSQASVAETYPKKSSAPLSEHSQTSRIQNESYYQGIVAEIINGKTEQTLSDGTRCDIITKSHAIEVDWASKWYESIGQSMWYSYQTNKRAGVVLLKKNEADSKYILRMSSLILHRNLDIDVWVYDIQTRELLPIHPSQ